MRGPHAPPARRGRPRAPGRAPIPARSSQAGTSAAAIPSSAGVSRGAPPETRTPAPPPRAEYVEACVDRVDLRRRIRSSTGARWSLRSSALSSTRPMSPPSARSSPGTGAAGPSVVTMSLPVGTISGTLSAKAVAGTTAAATAVTARDRTPGAPGWSGARCRGDAVACVRGRALSSRCVEAHNEVVAKRSRARL